MGQTLTHGVYLPDEGERNCYSGLAANWQLLDGAVGTVAEHTSQIAGKAADSAVVHKSENEIISGVKSFLDTNIRFNSSSYVSGTPSANIFYAPILIGGVVNNADKNTFQHNAAIRTTGINDYSIRVYSQTSNTLTGVVAETNADASNISFRPIADSTHNLGTSSYRWKTLNGVNPGALSLPDYTLAKVDLIDFSQWSVSGQRNEYTPVSDGWLSISIKDTASNSIFIYAHSLYNTDSTKSTDYRVSCFGNGSQGLNGRVAVMIPVRTGIVYGIYIIAASVSEIYSAKFYPALGNV